MPVFRSAVLACLLLGGCAAPLTQMAGAQLMQPQTACPTTPTGTTGTTGTACPGTSIAGRLFQTAGDSLHKLTGLASADPAPAPTTTK